MAQECLWGVALKLRPEGVRTLSGKDVGRQISGRRDKTCKGLGRRHPEEGWRELRLAGEAEQTWRSLCVVASVWLSNRLTV